MSGDLHERRPWRELLRWSGCGALVLAAHAALALGLLHRSEDADVESGEPVITIELAPVAVAPPAPITDLAPGPEQPEAESAQIPMQEAQPEPEPEVKPDTPPVPEPEVILPRHEPERREEQPEMPQEAKEAAPVPTAPPSVAAPAPAPAAAAVGRVARPSARELASWQRLLVAQLERHKRYPAQANGRQGAVKVAFTVDHHGHVLKSRVAESSGSPILDAEALAMIRRAEPLPAPPREIADEALSFTLPIRYGVGARR